MNPRLLTIPRKAYHEGQFFEENGVVIEGTTEPAFSNSIASILAWRSPLHAWWSHPKLNPGYQPEEKDIFDLGTAAHDILLEGLGIVEIVDAKDWRSNAAKDARDAARLAGRIPLLTEQAERVEAMVYAVREQLEAHEASPTPFTEGAPEQTIVWEEQGVLCKARLDWLRDDLTVIDDFKTTGKSAHPASFQKNLYYAGFDVQAAFYLRGLRAWIGSGISEPELEPRFRWIVAETKPPFALSVVTPSRHVLELANMKIDYALKLWAESLESGYWPGYGSEVVEAGLPDWEERRWLEREEMEAEE